MFRLFIKLGFFFSWLDFLMVNFFSHVPPPPPPPIDLFNITTILIINLTCHALVVKIMQNLFICNLNISYTDIMH
jgi:hypothetical protein